MKKNSILGGVVLMMAALLAMIACNKIDVQMDDETVDAVKTIPYTVKVGSGDPSTRATVESDYQTLHFAEGDKLYVTGTNIQGVLNIQTGAGTANATFSGNLTYSGSGSPADNLALTATLVSAQQTVGEQISVDANGAVTMNYPYLVLAAPNNSGSPSNPFCTSVNDAVQKYSRLTGTSTYGAKSFTLTQQTAFLNFEITLLDRTAGTKLDAAVSVSGTGGLYSIYNADYVTTTTDSEKVVAKFVLPVASGITIDRIHVNVGINAYKFYITRNMTLEGKVYNVKRTFHPLTITSPKVGQVIGSDGKNYDSNKLSSDVTAVAMICYKGSDRTYGLALAMEDESDRMDWNTARITVAAHTPMFSRGTWRLASQEEWNLMFAAAGNSTGLSNRISNAGGKGFVGGYYSSTLNDSGDSVKFFIFAGESWNGLWQNVRLEGSDLKTRACLDFPYSE